MNALASRGGQYDSYALGRTADTLVNIYNRERLDNKEVHLKQALYDWRSLRFPPLRGLIN